MNIIVELAKVLRQPEVFAELRECLEVFAPGVRDPLPPSWLGPTTILTTSTVQRMPAGLVYSLAPWGCALEVLWSIVRQQWRQPGGKDYVVDPFLCNVAAVIEKTIAFGLTGNVNVLVEGVMDRLWVTLGIKKTGCPALDPKMAIIDLIRGFVCKRPDWWPKDRKNLKLLSAVGAAARFTYGDRVNDVRTPHHSCSHRKLIIRLNSTLTPRR